MKQLFSFLFFLMMGVWCNGQEKGTVHFAEKGYYAEDTSHIWPSYLLYLQGDTVTDFRKKYHIIVPEQFRSKKIAWYYRIFGWLMKTAITAPRIFYLVADYDSSTAQIVFDINGNADFSDDSIYAIQPGEPFTLELGNQRDTAAKILMRFLFYNDLKDPFYNKQWKSFKDKTVMPAKYMLFYKQLVYRRIVLPDSDIVMLWDYDANGFYDGPNDKIIAGDIWKDKYLGINPYKTRNVSKGEHLPFKDRVYRLIDIDKYGNGIRLEVLYETPDTAMIPPSFRFVNENGRNEELGYDEVAVFYVWNSRCMDCAALEPGLASLMKTYADKVSFYTFNSGDKEMTMLKHIETTRFPYQKNYLTAKNAATLQVETVPAFLVVYRKKVLLRTSNVQEVRTLLEK